MSTLFLILALLSFIFIIGGSILWLIRKIMKKDTKKLTKFLSICLGVFFISIVGNIATAGMGSESTPISKQEETAKVEEPKQEEPKQEEVKKEEVKKEEPKKEQKVETKLENENKKVKEESIDGLNIKLDDFISNFNSSKPAKEFKYKLDKSKGEFKKEDGLEFGTFQQPINDYSFITCSIKDGIIHSIMVNASGDGSPDSAVHALSGILCSIKATDTSIPDDGLVDVLRSTGWEDQIEFNGSTFKNGIKYTLILNKQLGMILGIEK